MDVDLIKLVNKLQDTFSHLGARLNFAVHLALSLTYPLVPCVEQQRRRAGHASAGRGKNPYRYCPGSLSPFFLQVGSQSAGKSSVLEKYLFHSLISLWSDRLFMTALSGATFSRAGRVS